MSRSALIDELITRKSLKDVIEAYETKADDYDPYFDSNGYGSPRHCAKTFQRTVPENVRGQLRLMDICCGTGQLGQLLWDAGVKHMDGLDGSSSMITIAETRGIYENLTHDIVDRYHRIPVKDNTYDVVTISAGFVPGHLPVCALDEFLRICKPGGYIINTMRFEYLVTSPAYHYLEPHMDLLERQGYWKRVERTVFDGFFQTVKQGITHVYQKI